MLSHRASAATQPGRRYTPPKAGFFYPVAALRFFADAAHRQAQRA
jgi:hypothetical protein